jgi:ribosomal-protein-alanine N-acetyltransferase
MPLIPTLLTERLRLRPFAPADAPELASLLADGEIATRLMGIPHPYSLADAQQYIVHTEGRFMAGDGPVWAIERRDDGALLGAVSLSVDARESRASLFVWVGRSFRRQGYATEAARGALYFGFRKLKLRRIDGWHFQSNPGGGAVLKAAGLQLEITRLEHILKDNRFEDVHCLAISAARYEELASDGRFVVMLRKAQVSAATPVPGAS